MKSVLLTGFGPFGGETVNPSALAVSGVFLPDDYRVDKLTLPVLWREAPEKLCRALRENRYDIILLVGQAGGSDKIRLERVGINLCGAIRDNDGFYPGDDPEQACEAPVDPQGPDAFFSTADFVGVLPVLREAKIPALLSYSAGTYLCNALLYTALSENRRLSLNASVGFVHVPYAPEQKKGNLSCMPIDEMSRALSLIITHL